MPETECTRVDCAPGRVYRNRRTGPHAGRGFRHIFIPNTNARALLVEVRIGLIGFRHRPQQRFGACCLRQTEDHDEEGSIATKAHKDRTCKPKPFYGCSLLP